MAGTKEDAAMVVELAKWGAMIDFSESVGALFDEEFDPETAESDDEPVRTVLAYMETIGTLVSNGLLDGELINDWLWVTGLWERVGPAAKRARDRFGEQRLYENFEALAASAAG
jgi:hypothetical protein